MDRKYLYLAIESPTARDCDSSVYWVMPPLSRVFLSRGHQQRRGVHAQDRWRRGVENVGDHRKPARLPVIRGHPASASLPVTKKSLVQYYSVIYIDCYAPETLVVRVFRGRATGNSVVVFAKRV